MESNLYDFSSNSFHAKFFKWMWGVDPSVRYKTMCPYFWSFVGSMLIFPLIFTYIFIKWMLSPITNALDARAERQARITTKELMDDINGAESDKDFYNIYKSKCYDDKLKIIDMDEDFDTDIFDTIYARYCRYKDSLESKRMKRKYKTQAKIDTFKYGSGGKILSYLMGIGALVGIGFFFYWFVHLFTMTQFLHALTIIGAMLIVVLILFLFIRGTIYIQENMSCDNKVRIFFNNIVFWKYIGLFFTTIWKGLTIIIDMIVNTYKQNCPTIHWDK
jgi:hypothetical protein